nr:GNAT family N-acetyltransferase [Evansella tamaricis]
MKDAYSVRREVFIEEQRVPEEIEIDDFEKEATHFIVYDNQIPIGAARLRYQEDYGKAERVCVLGSYRKKGVGESLMAKMEDVAKQHVDVMKLNAQTHAEPFYKRIGYKTYSDIFYDAGIPHVAMKKQLV